MRYLLSILLIVIGLSVNAQQTAKLIQHAKGEIMRDNYRKAAKILEPITDKQPLNKEAVKLAGICFLNIAGEEEKAWRYLEKAAALYPLGNNPSQSALETHFYLAQALHRNYEFEKAIAIYENLLRLTSSKSTVNAIYTEMRYCYSAIELVENPREYKIFSLGEAINSPYEEHSPLVDLDESVLYFTSNRPVKGMEKEDGEYFENIYVSYWKDGSWTQAELLNLPGNYFGNRATVSLSADGNTMIIYQNDGFSGSLFITQFNGKRWSEPTPLPVNSTKFNETHACFSPDGKELWITSDRPGGYGGIDIYVSRLLPNGKWGTPENAGPAINTEFDEESPFISPDGNFLYFSSEGHNSMGGFDIFVSEKNHEDGTWKKPQNVGYPINTPNDDVFYIPSPDGERVYYSSRRLGGVGESDLYLLVFPDDDVRALAVLAGHIFVSDEMPANEAVIRITDEKGKFHGIYRPNPLTGKFVAILPTGLKYMLEIEHEGYRQLNKEVTIHLREVYGTRQRVINLEKITLVEE